MESKLSRAQARLLNEENQQWFEFRVLCSPPIWKRARLACLAVLKTVKGLGPCRIVPYRFRHIGRWNAQGASLPRKQMVSSRAWDSSSPPSAILDSKPARVLGLLGKQLVSARVFQSCWMLSANLGLRTGRAGEPPNLAELGSTPKRPAIHRSSNSRTPSSELGESRCNP